MDDAGIALVILLFTALALAGLAFWIWALVDAIRVPDDAMYESGTKLVWVLVIVLAGLIGAIIYVAVGRPRGTPKAPSRAIPPPPT